MGEDIRILMIVVMICLTPGASSVFGFGAGVFGAIGAGDQHVDRSVPTRAAASFASTPISALTVGAFHNALIAGNGVRVFTWGQGDFGKLGFGDVGVSRLAPTQLAKSFTAVNAISAGWGHTVIADGV